MSNVLIASLGESPAVVTAMYYKLLEHELSTIDRIIVLHPTGSEIPFGYEEFIMKELQGKGCQLTAEVLPFEDANNWANSYIFLGRLYKLVEECQKNSDNVYLSLAGWRKNMSALMAWVAPLFSCVQGLYHIVPKDERSFKARSATDLFLELAPEEQAKVMHPDLDTLELVKIPFSRDLRIDDEMRSRLLSATDEDLATMPEEAAEAAEFLQDVAEAGSTGRLLEVWVTEHVRDKFEKMCRNNANHARNFQFCFDHMRFPQIFRKVQRSHDTLTWRLGKGEQDSYSQRHNLHWLTFHFFKRGGAKERAVFHTVPHDIKSCPDEKVKDVETVIVSELEVKKGDDYRHLEEIIPSLTFPLEPVMLASDLPRVKGDASNEIILIVPLGTSPMIVTQLYTLLKDDGKTVRRIILVYPERSTAIANNVVRLVKQAFKEEDKTVEIQEMRVQGLRDIDSTEACEKYQKRLEEVVAKALEDDKSYQVELALSGGRKGMAALAMFVAQKKGLPHVYHTLITDEKLDKRVTSETEVPALGPTKVSVTERNDRLFLRAYEGNGPYTKFVLFKVPVLPAGGGN